MKIKPPLMMLSKRTIIGKYGERENGQYEGNLYQKLGLVTCPWGICMKSFLEQKSQVRVRLGRRWGSQSWLQGGSTPVKILSQMSYDVAGGYLLWHIRSEKKILIGLSVVQEIFSVTQERSSSTWSNRIRLYLLITWLPDYFLFILVGIRNALNCQRALCLFPWHKIHLEIVLFVHQTRFTT